MGLRFRRSVKLFPGVRLNVSGSGLSATVGPRGASVGFGRRGSYLNAGIPGTGLYARNKLADNSAPRARRPVSPESELGTVEVNNDGSLRITDSLGNSLSEQLVSRAKKQHAEVLRGVLETACTEINVKLDVLSDIHLYTPNPATRPAYQPVEFSIPSPTCPRPRQPSFLDRLFRSRREKLERDVAADRLGFERATQEWKRQRAAFDNEQAARRKLVEADILQSVDAMERFLSETLESIDWPRETLVSFEILDSGKKVLADVDLPEIEDLPNRTATLPQRGFRLSIKEMSATQLQKLYMRHVHGIGFRILGEVFAALPTVEMVVLSAYSQRLNPATAVIDDQYLYSIRASRAVLESVNFDNLSEIDVVETLSMCELKRRMSKTGAFKVIEPYVA